MKFSPIALNNSINFKERNQVNSSYVSVLLSPILAKLPKETNEIFKFFEKNPPSNVNKKSYAQVSLNASKSIGTNTVRETLKIKEVFPSLQNKKIEQVQKIISGVTKLKPHINMTTKGLSCKQVIISISIDNANNFVKESSIYIANINRALKNIKLDVIADFIRVKSKDIVVTNFIQLVSPQPVDQFSQTKLRWKVTNEGYPQICRMYKSDNK